MERPHFGQSKAGLYFTTVFSVLLEDIHNQNRVRISNNRNHLLAQRDRRHHSRIQYIEIIKSIELLHYLWAYVRYLYDSEGASKPLAS